MGEVVFLDDGYAIIRFDRPFGVGFNVYRIVGEDPAGLASGTKINDRFSWFKTLATARDWLQAYRRLNT